MSPAQKPGKSEQVVETPADFLEAVHDRFGANGAFDLDLACSEGNCKGRRGLFDRDDSLKADWDQRDNPGGLAWCNPPFGDLAPWVAKAAASTSPDRGGRILVLVPASIGSRWFADHVHGKALVLALSPRLTFVGHTAPYPKDLMLLVYGTHPGFDVWRWK